jgi:hypothetical protein
VSALIRTATALGLLTIVAALTLAQQEAPQGRRVRVSVVVILASEKETGVDPLVKCIAAEVRKRNPQLKGFQVDVMCEKSLAVSQKASFKLPKGETAQVEVLQAADKGNRVMLAVTPPCGGEIVYRTVCGKFLPIVTRCRTEAKERVILAIRVEPCNGK